MQHIHLVTLVSLVALALPAAVGAAERQPLATVAVQQAGDTALTSSLDGVVEAVRQTTLSTQVAGAIVSLNIKAGDRVKAGQELLRIDARAAQQGVAASAAQVEAARAQLKVASQELARQKQLHQKQYVSQAALERAQAQWEAAQAQVNALQAQARAAQTQSGFFVLNAPYAGVVSAVAITLGDMAMPGRPLLTMHDPAALRVTAAVPQAMLPALAANLQAVRYELPGVTGFSMPQQPARVELLPTVDAGTHSATLRLSLPAGGSEVAPGLFARVWLPAAGAAKAGAERLFVPAGAVARRAELTGVYVVDAQGKPHLRQVRLGRQSGDRVEVLTGLRAGDQVATDPQAAAALRRAGTGEHE